MRAALIAMTAVCFAVLSGCGKGRDGARQTPVVIYVASTDDAYLTELVKDYEYETGEIVTLRHGMPEAIVADQIAKRLDPPADVLITHSVADIQRAATQGALRPLAAASVEPPVPAWLRDPDGFWTAISWRDANIIFDPRVVRYAAVTGYAALADPHFQNRVCLSSSRNSVNRAVIAQLIAQQGVRSAELVVRGWIANLERPVFESDAEVLGAIMAGDCGIGFISSAVPPPPGADVAETVPWPSFGDASAAGIGRHARNPAGAAAFIEYLLEPVVQGRFTARTAEFEANRPDFNWPQVTEEDDHPATLLAIWHTEDAEKLAERAHYP